MRIAITGATRGIGEEIANVALENANSVMRLIRANGKGIEDSDWREEQIARVLDRNADVFVNNAYGPMDAPEQYQAMMLSEMVGVWKHDPTKTIISMGSIAGYLAFDGSGSRYRYNKLQLRELSINFAMNLDVKCSVIVLEPGYVATPSLGDPGNRVAMTSRYVAEAVMHVLRRPMGVRIPILAFYATNEKGNITNEE